MTVMAQNRKQTRTDVGLVVSAVDAPGEDSQRRNATHFLGFPDDPVKVNQNFQISTFQHREGRCVQKL